MALQKQEDWGLTHTTGQPTANYHRIHTQEFTGPTGIRVIVASYFDKDTFDNGGEPYTHRSFTFDFSTITDLNDVLVNKAGLGAATDVKTELYNAIKADTEQHAGFFSSGTTDV